MQYNAHKMGSAPVSPNVIFLYLHIKKGKDHFDTFNAHFCGVPLWPLAISSLALLFKNKNARFSHENLKLSEIYRF